MKKLLLSTLAMVVFTGCNVPFFSSGQAALNIDASESTSVYLNGNHVGQTPYHDENLKPGDYTVRLVVENNPGREWQTRTTLTSKTISVVYRDFGESDERSSNYLLQLEPIANSSIAELSIVTLPDNAIVKINDQPEGISPITVSPITVGDHIVSLTAPGYQEQVIPIKTVLGYRLVASAQLAKTAALVMPGVDGESATPSAELIEEPGIEEETDETIDSVPAPTTAPRSATATQSAQISTPYVEITETGTGWLRVRAEPNVSAQELTKVNVGTKYPYLETNDTGWHKIEYSAGEEGWIAGTYATIYR